MARVVLARSARRYLEDLGYRFADSIIEVGLPVVTGATALTHRRLRLPTQRPPPADGPETAPAPGSNRRGEGEATKLPA